MGSVGSARLDTIGGSIGRYGVGASRNTRHFFDVGDTQKA
jgi:hypothetical protein